MRLDGRCSGWPLPWYLLTNPQQHRHIFEISKDTTRIFFHVRIYIVVHSGYLFSLSLDSARVVPPTSLDAILVLKVEEFGLFCTKVEDELQLGPQLACIGSIALAGGRL